MRILRLKLDSKKQTLLKELARQHRISDKEFVYDLYALAEWRGAGVPDRSRCEVIAKLLAAKIGVSVLALKVLVNKRKQVLNNLAKLPYFLGLCSAAKSPMGVVRRLMKTFTDAAKAKRQAQCVTCKLFKQCDFGQQYSTFTDDIAKVVDADFKNKIHEDCPDMPDIERANAFAELADDLRKAAMAGTDEHDILAKDSADDLEKQSGELEEEDELSPEMDGDLEAGLEDEEDFEPSDGFGFGRGDKFTARFTKSIIHHNEVVLKSLASSDSVLYQLALKFEQMLNAANKGKFKPTEELTDRSKKKNLENLSEISKVEPSELAQPKEIFNAKLAKKELIIKTQLTPVSKKALLYLLIDVSYSMTASLGSGSLNCLISRAALSQVMCIAMTKRVRDDGGLIYFRFFDSSVSRMYRSTTKENYEEVVQAIKDCCFDGGGTDIIRAVDYARQDIEQAGAKEPLKSSEILLVTDCEDSFNSGRLIAAKGKIPLHVLDVSGKANYNYDAGAKSVLKKSADQYFRVDETELNIEKMVELL